jgi:predicted dienelactone hydrolase
MAWSNHATAIRVIHAHPVGLLVLVPPAICSPRRPRRSTPATRLEVPGTADGQAPIQWRCTTRARCPKSSWGHSRSPWPRRAARGGQGLILLSHGTGGTGWATAAAEALARHGYLVAALHPGDNWRDRSLLRAGALAAVWNARSRPRA